MNDDPQALVLEHIEDVTGHAPVQQSDGQWTARCPVHGDEHPSLSISVGDDGRILLFCHAGCEFADVLEALDLKPSDLFPSGNRSAVVKLYEASNVQHPQKPGRTYPTAESAFKAVEEAIARNEGPAKRTSWVYPSGKFAVARYDTSNGKTFRPFHNNGSGWVVGDPAGLLPLYHSDKALPADRVIVVEGEKCADAANSVGLPAVTSAHGAKSPDKSDWTALAGHDVLLVPDNDGAGMKYVERVAEIVSSLNPPAQCRIVPLPGLGDGDDIVEWIQALHKGGKTDVEIRSLFESMAQSAPAWAPSTSPNAKQASDTSDGTSKRRNAATTMVEIAQASGELFLDEDNEAYITVKTRDHVETHRIQSRPTRHYLRQQYLACFKRVPGQQALQDAVNTLEALAHARGISHPVYLRKADLGNRIYIDLGDEHWRCVEIDANGWRVLDQHPVAFRRPRAMKPLAAPVKGTVSLLRDFVSVNDDDFVLILSWLLAALGPHRPYPILHLSGEQGSAKSTAARIIRHLIDPHAANLRSTPPEARDLAIAADNSFALSFDNLSGLPGWLSDAFCCLATGGGFATRTLYSDRDEEVFTAMRPIILNGIADCGTRPDLLDRSILVTLEPIPEERRLPESDLWNRFEAVEGQILGALLDVVAVGLKLLPHVKINRLPRMADFAKWIEACAPGLGWAEGHFLRIYRQNREAGNAIALEGDPVAAILMSMVSACGGVAGTAAQLLDQFTRWLTADDRSRAERVRQAGWPKGARGLAAHLRRIAPVLRQEGFKLEFLRSGQQRTIHISRSPTGLATGDAKMTQNGLMTQNSDVVVMSQVLRARQLAQSVTQMTQNP